MKQFNLIEPILKKAPRVKQEDGDTVYCLGLFLEGGYNAEYAYIWFSWDNEVHNMPIYLDDKGKKYVEAPQWGFKEYLHNFKKK